MLTFVAGIFMMGCQKMDQLPQLEILVLNEAGVPVGEAAVGLFATYEEWLTLENPAQVWRSTAGNGKVIFSDLHEVSYFIYVRKGEMDNTLSEIELAEPLLRNTRMHIIIHIK